MKKKSKKDADILIYPPGYGLMFGFAKALQESKEGKKKGKEGKKDKSKPVKGQ